MRLVTKDLKDAPVIFKDASTLGSLEQIALGNINLINDTIYKGTYKDSEGKTQSHVRDKLNGFYFQKCAYCESFCKAEIEHYRPKKGVKEEPKHDGYYWLCYEWSNLIPSCRYCNTEGGKGNQFPIDGKRVYSPEFINSHLDKSKCQASKLPLSDELPFLIHPELVDPKIHLEFCWDENKKGIKLIEKDKSEKGKQTIKICNLNRDYLLVDRLKSVLFPIKQHINLLFQYLEKGVFKKESDISLALKIYFDQLREDSKNVYLPHTFLRSYIINSLSGFEKIMVPYIDNENQKIIVLEALRLYHK